MAAPYVDTASFRAALVEAEVLVPTAVRGLWQRSGIFEDVVSGLVRYIESLRTERGALRRWVPPVLPVTEFLASDYVRSFPDLIGSVDIFSGDDASHRALLRDLDRGEDWTSHLNPSETVLSSSVCHGLYGTLAKQLSPAGVHAEVCGFVFRHEPSLDPARMQSFRQFDYVRVGTEDEALNHRDVWCERGRNALRALGLPVRVETASDPFFGRVGSMLAANQVGAALKFELLVDNTDEASTAISSANYHEDHFGRSFGILSADGSSAHSACFGFGLERITLALFAHHGLDVGDWPESVRESLGR